MFCCENDRENWVDSLGPGGEEIQTGDVGVGRSAGTGRGGQIVEVRGGFEPVGKAEYGGSWRDSRI